MCERLNEAIRFASDCHAGQVRKFGGTPYILHPLEVAAVIGTITNDEDTLIAGLLHDTVEDCDVDPALIKEKFGARVAALVQSETEDNRSDRPPEETWKQRKEESLLMLENTKDLGVKIMWLGDKLSNIRSFHREFDKEGNAVWLHLHQKDPAMQQWYYETIAEDAEHINEVEEKAALMGYVRLMRRTIRRGGSETEEGRRTVATTKRKYLLCSIRSTDRPFKEDKP